MRRDQLSVTARLYTTRLCITLLAFACTRCTPRSTPPSEPSESYEPEMSAQDERDQGQAGGVEMFDREFTGGERSAGERGGDSLGGRDSLGGDAPAGEEQPGGQPAGEPSGSEPTNPYADLPPLSAFAENPSDQFLVDMSDVADGHPFRGADANRPHQGAHIYFEPSAFDLYHESADLEDLPKIYAVADGVVSGVDLYFEQRGGNYRYGLLLVIAHVDGEPVNINYSIEPFLDPQDPSFYEPFLTVSAGDRVEKGQVLAYMYSDRLNINAGCDEQVCPPSSQNAHIHFELNGPQGKMSPSIFTPEVSSAFRARINDKPRDSDCPLGTACEDPDYQACQVQGGIGYKLTPAENPFGDERVTCR